jgi:hypothetical protein
LDQLIAIKEKSDAAPGFSADLIVRLQSHPGTSRILHRHRALSITLDRGTLYGRNEGSIVDTIQAIRNTPATARRHMAQKS